MVFEGKELLDRPMGLNIWRAPTDNDRKVKLFWREASYDKPYIDCREVSATEENGGMHYERRKILGKRETKGS